MEHKYFLTSRFHGGPIDMGEKAIMSLLAAGEIYHVRSSHVGKDRYMIHNFEFKEQK